MADPDEKESRQQPERAGRFKKARAVICRHCPVCNAARRSPNSFIGRLLHHPVHSEHCPMWTAYQQVYGEPDQS